MDARLHIRNPCASHCGTARETCLPRKYNSDRFLAPVVAREIATGGTDANIEVGSANMTRFRAIANFDVHVVPVDMTKTQLLENALRQATRAGQ